MNKQGNIYTFIYTSVLVVIVAVLLALTSLGLRAKQTKNEEIANKRDILKSINIETTTENAEEIFNKRIGQYNYIVDFNGNKIEKDAFTIDMSKEIQKPAEQRLYSVFEAQLENNEVKYILQVRGAGLWGPVWGYVSLNSDKNTVYGVNFRHKGETPGLGAEIDKLPFQKQFQGKRIFDDSGNLVSIKVVKGHASQQSLYEVDAVSGGTITSKAVEAMLANSFQGYENFLKK